jgi:hypothetical protein
MPVNFENLCLRCKAPFFSINMQYLADLMMSKYAIEFGNYSFFKNVINFFYLSYGVVLV